MSNEVIKFGDAEAMAIAWLTGKLGSGVLIHTKVPDPRPPKFVQVVVTGGRRVDLAYRRAQLTFKCWGATEVEACQDASGNNAYKYLDDGVFAP
jgi:hypothetical protein